MTSGPTTVHLSRHGETDWNRALRWQGHTDIPLNALGLAQAALLAERLRSEGVRPQLVATSDLDRARRTALLAAEAVGGVFVEERDLREIDVGRWAGKTRPEAEVLDPGVLARIDAGEDLPRGGAERFAQLQARCGAAFDRLVARAAGGTLLIVSHGGPVRALLAHALGVGGGGLDYPQLAIGNTSLTTLVGRPGGWKLLRLDDRAHLAGMTKGPRGAEVEGA